MFDLVAGRQIGRWKPESGWADGYQFPGDGRIRMIRRARVPLDYSLEGEFLDLRKWFADKVARGTHHVIKDALARGAGVTGLHLEALRRGAEFAVAHSDERSRAENLRLLGEIEEQDGNLAAAFRNFREALALNSKIGVARKVEKLAKRLGPYVPGPQQTDLGT